MLTEREIFDQLRQSLRAAASAADLVAKRPESGVHYIDMRAQIKLAEGCCRQAAYWREDARWLQPGCQLEAVHQLARDWLHRPTASSKKLFTKLADTLRQMEKDLLALQTVKTGRVGRVLPRPQADGFRMTPGGLVVPASA